MPEALKQALTAKSLKMILQLYVEKKNEYDTLSSRLLYLIKKNVDFDGVADIRIFRKYTLDGIEAKFFDDVRHAVLADETVDNAFLDYLPVTSDYKHFTVTSPKDQFNEDIENLCKCLALCGVNPLINVKSELVIAVGKNVKETEFDAVRHTINIDGYEIVPAKVKPGTFTPKKQPKSVRIDGFIKMNDIEVYQFHRKNHIKMSSEEFCKVRDYFKSIGRDPLWLEVLSIDSCWSNRQRELDTHLTNIEIRESDLNIPVEIALDEYMTARRTLYGDRKVPVTLNDIAAIGLLTLKSRGQATDVERTPDGHHQIQTPVDIDGVYEQWALTFKGSKTDYSKGFDKMGESVGNHLSDRTLPYQAVSLNCIGLENVKEDKTDFKSLRQSDAASKFLTHCSVASSSYNTVIANSESMNVCFTASAAAAPKTNLQKPYQGTNDTVIMLGGKLTKDSLPHDDMIQRQNPMIKQKVAQLLHDSKAALMIKRSATANNGIVRAILDITDDGAVINLDRLIKDERVDISHAVSKPNERVLVLCDRENAPALIAAAKKIGLPANNIAVTDESQTVSFFRHGEIIASLDLKLLKYRGGFVKSDAIIAAPRTKLFNPLPEEFTELPLPQAFLRNLATNNYNEINRTDSSTDWSVGGNTVLAPLGGKYQATPEQSFVCKIPTGSKNTGTVTLMSVGCTPKITAVSPFHGAAFSVMESISKIVACGGNSLNVKFASAEHFSDPASAPIKWSEPVGAMLGAFEAQTCMGLPLVDNTVSIEPAGNFKSAFTFASFAVATAKSNEIISAAFKSVGSSVLLIPMPIIPKTGMPDFDKAKVLYRQFHYLSQSSKVISASVVKEGGAAAAVAKMSFGNRIGVRFTNRDFDTLFGDNTAALVVETQNPGAFSGMDTISIGKTIAEECFYFDEAKIPMSEALVAYHTKTSRAYWRLFSKKITMANIPLYPNHSEAYSGEKFLKPRVLIPTFGAEIDNCDLYRGFESAGASVSEFSFNYKHIAESRKALAELIEKSQIIALPNGDSDLFAANLPVFALGEKTVSAAIQTFLANGGLILGLGSGFASLLKLGLLGVNPAKASFAPNINATRVSGLVRTRVTSAKSPWLDLCEPGAEHTLAVSHFNGRFVADEATISLLAAGGRIATQYIDTNGKPSAKQPFNPNGSTCAIEGITSANGNVFGKMALSDRYTLNCYSNVPGVKDQLIFKSGVNYFK